jgi:hypothetical protein
LVSEWEGHPDNDPDSNKGEAPKQALAIFHRRNWSNGGKLLNRYIVPSISWVARFQLKGLASNLVCRRREIR